MPRVIDTHCHLTHPRVASDFDAEIERARAALAACVTIGTGVDDARAALDLTGRHPGFLYATAALDPFSAHALGEGFDDAFAELEAMVAGGAFVAVGECGLDYHYDLDPKAIQRSRLERHLDLAVRSRLPVVIHVREAHDDMAAVLSEHPKATGVIHSFTAGPEEAARYLELGWSLAFNGVLTYRNAEAVRQAASATPDDRLLVETDAPYLAPVPHRGRRCEPAHVAGTIDRLAALRNETAPTIAGRTAANARALFGLDEGRTARPGSER